MDKLQMHTSSLADDNFAALARLFPNAVTETIDENGAVVRAIDAEVLAQEINTRVVSGREERYQFTWPDKRKSVLLANAPIAAALRPCREESVNFDTTENLYIEGDNLEVLKLLRETYLNRIKMIYIDPTYNTGKDFIYADNYSVDADDFLTRDEQYDEQGNRMVRNLDSNGRFHTDWLNMIYPRLLVARDLLTEEGVIFISIDEREVHNLRKVCDEVFGNSNFAGDIIWKNSSKNDEAYVSIQHEYILVYVKSKAYNLGQWTEPKEGIDEILAAFDLFRKKYGTDWKAIHREALAWYRQFKESNPIYDSKHYNWMDERGIYFAADISGPNYGQYRYNVFHPITGKVCKEPASGWRYPESTMTERIKQNLVHFGDDETTIPQNKTYLLDTLAQSLTSMKYKDGRVASNALAALMGTNCFTNPKDVSVLLSLMKAIGLSEGDIVLDFFSGSAATAEAVFQLAVDSAKCPFIMVQVQEDLDKMLSVAVGSARQVLQNAISLCDKMLKPHYLTEIGKERIRRAGRKIVDESPLDRAGLDIGFRVLKLDSSNMKDVYYTPEEYAQMQFTIEGFADNIKPNRTDEDLLFQVMLDLGIPLSAKISRDGPLFRVDNNYLIACFGRVDTALITDIAKQKPYYAVFRDSSFTDDAAMTNFEQVFATYSPNTIRKVL
jgi:adenine-specific DNA-methyltransferase